VSCDDASEMPGVRFACHHQVYQSLCGYDYFILDQPLLNTDQEILSDLQACFEEVRAFSADDKMTKIGRPLLI